MRFLKRWNWWVAALFLVVVLAGCETPETVESDATAEPTLVVAATAEPTDTPAALAEAATEAPTSTKLPTSTPPPTGTSLPTSTAVPATATETATVEVTVAVEPTETAEATATSVPPTSVPAVTAEPQPEQTAAPPPTEPAPSEPTADPDPVLGVNLLPNGSFEEGHYNMDGVPELQLPNQWRLQWDTGPTGVGNAEWDQYVRPEVRVLSTAFLPADEHALYIYDGQHTVKIFKGQGAISVRLITDVTLEPGTYVIEAKMFPDIIQTWDGKQKVWPQDPTAAEYRFIVGDGGTVWATENYGQINVHNFTFTIDEPKTIPVGIALKGKFAIANNGWFIDDLSLRRIE